MYLSELQLRNILVKLIAQLKQSLDLLIQMRCIIKITSDFRQGESKILQSSDDTDMYHVVGRIIPEAAVIVPDCGGQQAKVLIVYQHPAGHAKRFGDLSYLKQILVCLFHIIINSSQKTFWKNQKRLT